jgi:uncharacterized membrane protein (UPF0127 family)
VSTRAQLAIAGVVALASAIGIGIIVARWVSGDDARASAPLGLHEAPAVAPFAGYREVSLAIDGGCVRVVLADTDARRERGLRGTSDLGPYAGMLFVQPGDDDVGFTMAGVRTPLDVVWFAADGARIDGARMAPCPNGTVKQCPVYRSDHPYRYALETPVGAAAMPNALGPC